MKSKSRSKPSNLPGADLSETEVGAWVRRNRAAINSDLAAARNGLKAGEGRPWNLVKFVARAQKRSATKKK
ncbi:MAG: hypothetical protein KBA31_07235 [Alphaproteobacteria bacterium]|nr:hypothetical protein [Alphaproteobacteria bacterium]